MGEPSVVIARRQAAAAALATFAGVAAALAAAIVHRPTPVTPAQAAQALSGRVGGPVADAEARLAAAGMTQAETGPFRRIYLSAGPGDERVHLDLTAAGRVRQVTLGRERAVDETFTPDAADWTLDRARGRATAWLPRDAAHLRREPFVFRDAPAGSRDVYRSPALAAVISAAQYLEHDAAGPPGMCAITYYQTTAGGVALILIGLH
jgi:hypothetical protein